ncbi:MAG: hypothetical protein DA405_02650 [Bacteroidetes bacterium]|nr:MAG: hypothetical protein DA405_02650 [Bacteroidota bacterium]
MRGLTLNFTSTHQIENPRGFSEVGENKQLLIAIVGKSLFFNLSYYRLPFRKDDKNHRILYH